MDILIQKFRSLFMSVLMLVQVNGCISTDISRMVDLIVNMIGSRITPGTNPWAYL